MQLDLGSAYVDNVALDNQCPEGGEEGLSWMHNAAGIAFAFAVSAEEVWE